jgi:small nuclear ribonucleoprotein (snRNP)-like protein
MDTYQNWSVYLMQTDQTMNIYLKPPKNIKENPSFIASASVKKFGCSKHSRCGCLRNASVALIASTTKNEPPSIVVGMKGGIQRIQFVNPHLWDVKKKGNPVKHQSNWKPTNVKTNHQNIVSHIHIVQNVVMISCDQRINFISLLPNNTYGMNMTVADKEPVKYGEWTDAGSGIMSYKRYEPTEYRSKTEIGVVVAIDHYIQKNKCVIFIASACNEIRRFEISASNELEYIETYDLSSLPPIHSLAILNHTDDSSELCLGTETGRSSGRSYITISTNTNQKKKEQKSWLEQQSEKENNTISLVLPGSKEYNGVLTEYDRAYMGRGGSPQGEIHIQNVYRVQNFELYQRYKSFIKNKSSTSTNNNRTTSVLNTALGDTALEAINRDEKRLFHGEDLSFNNIITATCIIFTDI